LISIHVDRLARTGDAETLELILVGYGGVSDLNHLCDEGKSVRLFTTHPLEGPF
jgi:hypothetical protein